MRTFPALYSAEIVKEAFKICHLFKIELTSTYRWTDFSEDIYFDSQWWTKKDIKFDSAQLSLDSKVDSTTLLFTNIDKAMSDIILGERIAGKPITVYRLVIDKNLNSIGATTEADAPVLFLGKLDRAEGNRRRLSIQCYNHFIYWQKQTPRRRFSVNCGWQSFKDVDLVVGTDSKIYAAKVDHLATSDNKPITGANYANYWEEMGTSGGTWTSGKYYYRGECRYAGSETTCDRTWKRCTELSNTANYGGFRHLGYLSEKDIMWGKVAKNWAVK